MSDPMGNLWGDEPTTAKSLNKSTDPLHLVPNELPSDQVSEKSFLATIAYWGNSPKAVDLCIGLTDKDFYAPQHRILFNVVRSLQAQGAEINFVTLQNELQKAGMLDRVGGFQGLTDILQAEEVDKPDVLAGFIKEKSALREIISIGSKMAQNASALGEPQEIISTASEALTRLATGNPMRELISDMSDLIDDVLEGKAITTENGGRAMSWGDDMLDSICPIPRGEPTLIVARPGVGKSALGCIQVPVATYLKGLGKPLVLSLEMNRQKIKARLAGHISGTNSREFRDASYKAHDVEAIAKQRELLGGIKWMFPKQECPVEEIESLINYAIDVHGIDCVVLDQFSHLLPPQAARKEPFAMGNAALSRRITALAKNLNLGWVTLGQINREGDDSRRPNMKDLADTDRLAKDAAVIFGLWNVGQGDVQEVWGTIIKNRDDGHKGWARKLSSDYGTCHFNVEEQETKLTFTTSKRLKG